MKPDKAKLATFLTEVQIAVTKTQCAPLASTEATRLLSQSFDSIRATIDECKAKVELL